MLDYKIIKVQPVPVYFSITWMLGSRCNYDCMYCPTELHDNTSSPHSIETLQQAWQNIYKKTQHQKLPYKISFTGGEITANKNFLPFVIWLRKTYHDIGMISITTNGSASLSHYLKLANYVESISFSTHSEHMDEQTFFKKASQINKKMIRPEKSFHVNIMNEFWNQDRIPLYKEFLKHENISYSTDTINYKLQTRTIPIIKGKKNLHESTA
jgi:MoaA/NifB/PqqE/SkfB family radical SAM enzyme